MSHPHLSVLLQEVIDTFKTSHLRVFLDGTLGAGGHSEAILQHHPEIELLIGIDQDDEALSIAKQRLQPWQDKISLVKGNFQEIEEILKKLSISNVDGILLDVGVSSMQLDQDFRGFSFMREGPLDMRMDRSSSLTASEIVNSWEEADLGRIFREYGEEKQWRKCAQVIVKARKEAPITTTIELKELLSPLFSWKKKGVNPLTLIFQALRIAVNNELEVLAIALDKGIKHLAPEGRFGVISFHSLEDRIVKNKFRYEASDKENTHGLSGLFIDKKPNVKLITKKPLIPTEEETKINPRARSAKMRVIEKI